MDASSSKKAAYAQKNRPTLKSADYKDYVRRLISDKIKESDRFVLSLSTESIVFRASILLFEFCVIYLCVFSLKLNIFRTDPLANVLLFSSACFFSVLVFLFGIAQVGLAFISTWLALIISHSIAGLSVIWLNTKNAELITGAGFTFFCAAIAFVSYINIRTSLFDDDIEYFERGADYVAVNDVLSDYAPVGCFPFLLVVKCYMHNPIPVENAMFITELAKLSRLHHSVLAGFINHEASKEYTFYIYTLNTRERCGTLIKKMQAEAKKCHIEENIASFYKDAEWNVYFSTLLPDKAETIEIRNRNMMEELFSVGIDFEEEYMLCFTISYANEEMLEALKDKLCGHGFIFAGENDEAEEEEKSADFLIESFISNRRIEYLSGLITDVCKQTGALYEGDWTVEM